MNMTDFSKLSPAAIAAAARGGIVEWGKHGSIAEHVGYVEPQDARGGHYLKCLCGCNGRAKHRAMFNGVCMAEGCELSMHRFVKRRS